MVRIPLPPIEKIPGGAAFASLSRRVRTLIVAGAVFVVLFVLVLAMPVPYVILSPGPTYNTLGTYFDGKHNHAIIAITGRAPAKRSGHLNLTTVGVSGGSVSAYQALVGWLRHDEVVVPRAAVYPPGQSQQQTEQQNSADFQQSQDSATAAALCELGYPKGFGVIDVEARGPSAKVLRPGDQFVSVNGAAVGSRATLDAALGRAAPGTTVPIVVKRGSTTATVRVRLGTLPKGSDRSRGGYLGVVPDTTCLAPFTVDLRLSGIGGPSAGLMFALGILDKVGRGDLTRGRFIAGTGTIDPNGTVGPIGGIALKMIAAHDKGATVFLAPAGNCAEVRAATPAGLRVVKVDTLHGAVQDLGRIQRGQAVPHC